MRKLNPELYYYIVTTLSAATMGILSWLAFSQLDNYGESIYKIKEAFGTLNTAAIRINLITFLVLTVLALIIYRRTQKGRYFLFNSLIFAVFSLISYTWLESRYFLFLVETDALESGSRYLAIAMGISLAFGGVMVSACTYLIARFQKSRAKRN